MVQGVNSQRPAIQPIQTQQNAAVAQPAQQQKSDPLQALSQALAALEQAVQALSGKGFNNNQSVAQSAGQNLGTSGASKQPAFDFSSLFNGGSVFDQKGGGAGAQQNAAPTPPVQNYIPVAQTNNDFLNGSGGGAGPIVHGNSDHHIQQFGDDRSGGGGGVHIGSDGANNSR